MYTFKKVRTCCCCNNPIKIGQSAKYHQKDVAHVRCANEALIKELHIRIHDLNNEIQTSILNDSELR